MIKYLSLLLLVSQLSAASRIETVFKCIDNKLFVQTVAYDGAGHGTHVVSASLVQVFSQWGSAIAVTDCKTHDAKLR